MKDLSGNEVKHYWVCVLVTLPNGTKVPRYREVSKTRLDALRQEKAEFYGIAKSRFDETERPN